jgi:hypothetical protein
MHQRSSDYISPLDKLAEEDNMVLNAKSRVTSLSAKKFAHATSREVVTGQRSYICERCGAKETRARRINILPSNQTDNTSNAMINSGYCERSSPF